jgi:hypothetical protein
MLMLYSGDVDRLSANVRPNERKWLLQSNSPTSTTDIGGRLLCVEYYSIVAFKSIKVRRCMERAPYMRKKVTLVNSLECARALRVLRTCARCR